jgi:hypothetical protein
MIFDMKVPSKRTWRNMFNRTGCGFRKYTTIYRNGVGSHSPTRSPSTNCYPQDAPIDQLLESILASYSLDEARARSPYSPELIAMIKEARREKIRNKTRERERERRGEILPSTIRRMNKGPPAHVLSKMTPDQRRRDRILRGPGEAGYTGQVKRQAGMKLKRRNLTF